MDPDYKCRDDKQMFSKARESIGSIVNIIFHQSLGPEIILTKGYSHFHLRHESQFFGGLFNDFVIKKGVGR